MSSLRFYRAQSERRLEGRGQAVAAFRVTASEISEPLIGTTDLEGGEDDQGPDCFCYLATLRSRGTRISVGAAKRRISRRLDQR
jgi:hypothetical protein